jgi:hypothetical protein
MSGIFLRGVMIVFILEKNQHPYVHEPLPMVSTDESKG